jgi:predicted enzyme related to lactoylglutathione lyase
MNRVVHFELGASDPARAVEFYKNVFGWEAQKWGAEEYWLMKTGSAPEAGIDGAILRNKDSQPRTVNSIQVTSLEESAEKVESHGGKVVVPKMTIPGVGYVAYCTDTEGNIFGIYQPDHSAK